jgi:hypothetical protein
LIFAWFIYFLQIDKNRTLKAIQLFENKWKKQKLVAGSLRDIKKNNWRLFWFKENPG